MQRIVAKFIWRCLVARVGLSFNGHGSQNAHLCWKNIQKHLTATGAGKKLTSLHRHLFNCSETIFSLIDNSQCRESCIVLYHVGSQEISVAARFSMQAFSNFVNEYVASRVHFKYHVGPFGKEYSFNKGCKYCDVE
jgi:hypothetical protein